MSNNDKQFSDWLDGKTTNPFTSEENENNDVWEQRVAVANNITHQAFIDGEQEVPKWDRGATFTSEKEAWWQWNGLPALSMAFSVMAIALVLFKVELVVQDEGVLLSFAGSSKTAEIEEEKLMGLVDLKLREFAAEQQVMLANYATDFTQKQQDSNLQLATYVIGATRQERKEDFTDFVLFINEQRKDEVLDQKIKFQQLERAINKSDAKPFKQDSTSKNKPAEVGYKLQPANWTTEE